ncbi:MAG: thioredoxin domain-containing protein [Promethearchaeota archaeon]|nr:MAG: thioredoxin domain-containing protein [Candidatus Lokiarchaeota archaeon]
MSMNSKNAIPNHLVGETSPYLKQHMYNPVDWYPWGKLAFDKAKSENKPIFLSIGYSTCHWCHVMAHESFEDKKIAQYLNEHFVSIKLDREERPDLDQIYQHVIQMMGRRGGWPLSIFMTPDKKPFFAGTYFPNVRKYGMDSFSEVLEKIVSLFEKRRHDVVHTGNQIIDALGKISTKSDSTGVDEISMDMLELAMVSLEASFDSYNGGFGAAPKFPNFPILLFIIREIAENSTLNPNKYTRVKKELEYTLDQMAAGGIYDHLGGGFARYSVDDQWMIPHFEKMLYDNALALQVYSEAYYLYQKPRYRDLVRETVDWVIREMYHEKTGFYSAVNADSEGEEGKFYVWTKSELEDVIPPEKRDLFFKVYGVTEKGNFEHSTNHLHVVDKKLAEDHRIDFRNILDSLEVIRRKRIPPSLDNKILTAWSSLMIKGLYSAYRILHDSKIKEIAHTVIRSIHEHMFSPEEKNLYRVLDANTMIPKIIGHLDDYAYFIQALFEDFQYFPDPTTLTLIKELLDITYDQFWDGNENGFFYSSSLNLDTFIRLKTGSDMPLPNPNSVMAENLLQYHFYIADPDDPTYLERAEQTILSYIETAYSHPTGFGAALIAAQWYLYGSTDIVITDEKKTEEEIYATIHNFFIPRLHLWNKKEIPLELHSFSRKFDLNSKYSFFFCLNFNCLPPTSDWDVFLKQLNEQLIKLL